MRKSAKSAFVWALGFTLLWVLLMLGGLLLMVWDTRPFPKLGAFNTFTYHFYDAFPLLAEREVFNTIYRITSIHIETSYFTWALFLVFPIITGCCVFYAVLKLRESLRAWSGYVAAAVALAFFSLTTFAVVSILVTWDEDSKGMWAILVHEGPPEKVVEFFQTSPLRDNRRSMYELLAWKCSWYTSEILHQLAQTFLSEQKNKNKRALRKLQYLAEQPNMDAPTLVLLAETLDASVQSIAASHLKTPVEILRKLSLKKDGKINRNLAFNPSTPTDILHGLAHSSDREILRCVARNPNTASEDLAMLAKIPAEDADSLFLLGRVADNPNTPTETLHDLANSSDEYIRRNVARNPNTSREDLLMFFNSPYKLHGDLAGNPSTPLEILNDLANSSDTSIRTGVGKNPNASKKILDKLSRDSDEGVRYNVAKNMASNPQTGKEELETLAQDPNVRVRIAVLKNPNCPEEIKSAVIEKLRSESDDVYGSIRTYFEEVEKN